MTQAIFFDLDQTLLDRARTFQSYLAHLYTDVVAPLNVPAESFYTEIHRWDDNGYRDKLETFALTIEHLSLSVTAEQLFAHFRKNYGHDAVLFDGVAEVLGLLKRNYPLALITNGRTKGQQKKLDITGIGHFFDHVLISEAEGIKKPEPELYLRACQKMNVAPGDVIFVGDHPTNDIAAPKKLGMRAIWVRNEVYAPPIDHDGIIQSVAELPTLL
ncbi:HAD family hydrolase [Reinekea sp. G2M2-21]|uniref:HAD family hydrolase n=1 Tax=Reinekea sp. G2M2-21 TaxID=2788942 RepID=UPI0018AB93DD|nr:HAD family hydrolase [Reinekea sp. G2M2-21]